MRLDERDSVSAPWRWRRRSDETNEEKKQQQQKNKTQIFARLLLEKDVRGISRMDSIVYVHKFNDKPFNRSETHHQSRFHVKSFEYVWLVLETSSTTDFVERETIEDASGLTIELAGCDQLKKLKVVELKF